MEPIDPKDTLNLTVSVEETNLLIAGLGKLPLEASAQLWMKIREQAAQQLAQPAAPGDQAGLPRACAATTPSPRPRL
jgi:hypothetical protein